MNVSMYAPEDFQKHVEPDFAHTVSAARTCACSQYLTHMNVSMYTPEDFQKHVEPARTASC